MWESIKKLLWLVGIIAGDLIAFAIAGSGTFGIVLIVIITIGFTGAYIAYKRMKSKKPQNTSNISNYEVVNKGDK